MTWTEDTPTTTQGPPAETLLLTVPEAATLLRLGRSKTYELIANGSLEIVRIGRSIRVTRLSVEEFVTKLRATNGRYHRGDFPSKLSRREDHS